MTSFGRYYYTLIFLALIALAPVQEAVADPFTSSYRDGGSWNTLYAQGFNAFVNDDPNIMIDFGSPIPLSRFEFFKSGNVDEAADIQLAIVDNIFLNLETFTTDSPELIGLSSNTLPTTANIITGDPLRFDFDDLMINFGDYYGAIFVNVDELGTITPVLVSALHTNYVETEPGSGVWLPETNYDFDPENPADFLTSTSNFLNTDEFGTFLVGFEGVGDANFVAYYDYTFPPIRPADFNEDGNIDGDDLTDWERNFGPFIGADADGDGDSDGADFFIWQRSLDATPLVSGQAVPEPSAALLMTIGILLSACNKRRHARQ